MINVDDVCLLIVLGQQRLSTEIVGGIKSPLFVVMASLTLGFGGVVKRGGGLQQ